MENNIMSPIEDIENLEFIENSQQIKLYYRFTPADIPDKSPILIILHGHGAKKASKFRDPKWNVLAPIDNYGKDSLGSWWLGENGNNFVLELLHSLIRKIETETQSSEGLYFWGSSMGRFGALLHGMLLNAKAVYANIPQVKLLGTTYSEAGMKKYFEPIFDKSDSEKFYNDVTNILNVNNATQNPLFFIAQSEFDYKNYMEEHALYFANTCKKYNINVDLEIFPVKGHELLLPIHKAVRKVEQTCLSVSEHKTNRTKEVKKIEEACLMKSEHNTNRAATGLIFNDVTSYAKFPEITFHDNGKWKLTIHFQEYSNAENINFFFGERGSRFHGFARVKSKIMYRLSDGSYIGGFPYTVGSFIRLTVTYDNGAWLFTDGERSVEVQQKTDVVFNAIGSGFTGYEHEEKTSISYVGIQEYSETDRAYNDVGVWKLNENRGCIAFDSSGNQRHAVLTNTKWQDNTDNELILGSYPLAQEDWQQYTHSKPSQKFEFLDEAYNKEKDLFLWTSIGAGLNDKNWKKAEKLLENIYSFERFEPVHLSTVLTWKENPLSNRSWQWQFHQLIFYIDLLAAHSKTEEAKYLDRLVELLTSWYDCNYAEEHPSEMSWHDHTTALRLRSLIYIWEYLRNSEYNITEDFANILLNLIETHCNVLSVEKFYMKHNNHGFDQSLFLYLASMTFPEFENAKQWHDIAFDRLVDEVGIAFTSEGIHVENSPSYLVGMIQRVDLASKMIQHYEPENNIELNDIINNALKALAYLVHPNGTLPMLGDTDPGTRIPALNHLKNNTNFQLFQYVHSQAQRGKVGENLPDAVFEESGYTVLRDKWHEKDTYDDMIHLVFKCSFLSTFHRHDDDLNFILHGLGEEWFVDGGIYKYNEQDPYRKYLRSAKSHNIPVIPNAEVSRIINKDADKQSKITDYFLNEETSWVEAKSYMYPGFCITRTIEYIRPNRFIIIDKVTADSSDDIQPYDLMFHIPADKHIALQKENSVVINGGGAHQLDMLFDGECIFELELSSGKKDGEILGWQAKRFNQLEEIQSLRCKVTPLHKDAVSIVEISLFEKGSL
jgi:hypothetical protein